MKKRKSKSIFAMMLTVVLIMVVIQTVFISVAFIYGGIFNKMAENASEELDKVVNSRVNYLESEMKNNWSNIMVYQKQITKKLNILNDISNSQANSRLEFFKAIEEPMIAIMRKAMVTDCFVILDDELSAKDQHPALYFRDYSPLMNGDENSDICILAGPIEMTKGYSFGEDLWNYNLTFDENKYEFYSKPYSASTLSEKVELLGYWSKPFTLPLDDEEIITYTIPLCDEDGNVYGVMGIGITLTYLNKFLPAEELAEDSLGYMIAYSNPGSQKITPIVVKGNYQEKRIGTFETLDLKLVDEKTDTYVLTNYQGNDDVYVCMNQIELYGNNTPFENEKWYLLGFVHGKTLFALAYTIQKILLYSLLITLPIGTIYGVFASIKFTSPIISLANKVRYNNSYTMPALDKTYLLEVDELASAIEIGNRNFIDSKVKMSQILDLVDISIGAFEYSKDDVNRVLATAKFKEILNLSDEEAETLYSDKNVFINKLIELMSEPADNNHTYRISREPDKWVKFNIVDRDNDVLGIIMDVTDEFREKERLKYERDIDALTGLCSNRSFRQKVMMLLSQGDLKEIAMIMFDLDDFKKINDAYGHNFGDYYLKMTAVHLGEMAANGCVVGRRSGDEFFVFLYDFENKEEINRIIAKFYDELEKDPVILPDGSEKIISISAGVAWREDGGDDYETLLEEADKLLYIMKNEKKNKS